MKSKGDNMGDKEMTRYAFISHMEDYMKELLRNPLKADTDEFLHGFGIDGPSALKMLVAKTDPNDDYSAVVIRSERIKDNGYDEDGKRNKDTFEVKYKIPRKDFKKKLRNLYINLFEQNIIKDCPINEDLNYHEMPLSSTPSPFKDKKFGKVQSQCKPGSTGDRFAKYVNDNEKGYEPKLIWRDEDEKENLDEGAWGYGILDNDSALDMQTSFSKICLNVLCSKVEKAKMDPSYAYQGLWANVGVLVDFLKKYKDNEIQLCDEYTHAINVVKDALNTLYNDKNCVSSWSEPEKFKSSLKKVYKEISLLEYQKDIMNIEDNPKPVVPGQPKQIIPPVMPQNGPIMEDGEGGAVGSGTMDGMANGAPSAANSGQYTTPLFGKPLKRKSLYLTQEQVDYIKEATATSNVGNYQYDVPMGQNDDFYGETMDHKDIMKKSFEANK